VIQNQNDNFLYDEVDASFLGAIQDSKPQLTGDFMAGFQDDREDNEILKDLNLVID